MKVLVVGATGEFAGLVVPELKKRQVEVYALIHDKEKKELALQHGADQVIVGDLEDEPGLLRAATGMHGVFHIIPAFQSKPSGSNVRRITRRGAISG